MHSFAGLPTGVNPPGLLVMRSTVVTPLLLCFIVAYLCCFTFHFPGLSVFFSGLSSPVFFLYIHFHPQEWMSFFGWG